MEYVSLSALALLTFIGVFVFLWGLCVGNWSDRAIGCIFLAIVILGTADYF